MTHRPRRRAGAHALAACLLALSAPALAAQSDSLPARLAPATRAAILRLADSLRGAGLPAEPLYSKAQEGVLKGIDDTRILAAERTLAVRLGESRDALGTDASSAEIVAGASALYAGVPGATLRRLREDQPARGARPLAVALVVLSDLVTRGVPAPMAASTVESLAARGVGENEYVALRQGVERDIGSGRSPAQAVESRARAVIQQWDASRGRPPRP